MSFIALIRPCSDHATAPVVDAQKPVDSASTITPIEAKDGSTPASTETSQLESKIQDIKPVENVAPGLAPVADFVPKDRPASHPTPPPDDVPPTHEPSIESQPTKVEEPIVAESRTVEPKVEGLKVEESTVEETKVEESTSSVPKPSEPSLVRPREDESEDAERVAKRPKIEADDSADTPMPDAPQTDPQNESKPTVSATDDDSDVKAAPTQPSEQDVKPPAATSDSAAPPAASAPETASAPPAAPAPAAAAATAPASDKPSYSKDPMTPAQKTVLLDKMKNLKKTRNSGYFLKPVDYVALNIPAYPDIIKNPMDLTTMETKLKNGEYGSVQDFADDFDLIISNTRRFNGDAHAVTSAGFAMEAYFRNMMKYIPSTDEPIPQKAQKKQSPAFQKAPAPRRESRSANAPTPAPAPAASPATNDTFALQADGTPQIRRDASINRPNRAIKPPQNREIAYGKPKRKENQPELKFCEMVLNQIVSNKYQPQNNPFLAPVDPVALNIPNYNQIVKHPMDLSTMRTKLKNGDYGKAGEFKKDFDLIISNCFLFNPPGNAVRQLGVQLQKDFENLWAGKEKFVQKRKAESQRAASVSADDDSGDEEEDEEDATESAHLETIRVLQKQLLDMQNALAGLGKPIKTKKTKSKSSGKKASNSATTKTKPSKPKAAKKPRQVTYDEKQEISSAVENLEPAQLEKLTSIITENCSKYAEMEEMELEIDDLPNNVQLMLLDYVRSIFGNPNRVRAASPDDLAAMDDDDFEPERGGRRGGAGGGKRKKHKPMGKREQQETIKQIQSQLAQFNQPGSGSAAGGTAQSPVDESSEEDSEESEEE